MSEDEAFKLAESLKKQLRSGEMPSADSEHIAKMVAGLGDPRGLLRRTFAKGLGQIGSATLPALRNALLKNSNVTVRRAAAKTLKLVGDPKALPDLHKAFMNDPDPVVQGSCVGAMVVFGEAAISLLQQVLDNPKSTEMQCGLASWGFAFAGRKAPQALWEATKSKSPKVRAAAIAAFGDQIHLLKDKQSKELLLAALNDHSTEVQAEATTLIGQLNEPKWAIPFLIMKLENESAEIRKQAALAIMKLRIDTAIDILRSKAFSEKDSEVKKIMSFVISQLEKI